MKGKRQDDDLLCSAGDEIDNAVFAAILSLSPSENRPEWDMSLIGEATDAIESVMERHGLKVCRPWQDEDETICYCTEDRCKYCTRSQ